MTFTPSGAAGGHGHHPCRRTCGVHAIAGGQPRELLRVAPPEAIGNHLEWTPDGSAIVTTRQSGAKRELWLIPVSEASPRKLDIDPNLWMGGSARPGEPTGDQGFVFSPDSRTVAFLEGKTGFEVWTLENFLPATSTKR